MSEPMTPDVHQLAMEIRAAIFSGEAPASTQFNELLDTLSTWQSTIQKFEGGPDGELASLEFDLASDLAKLFLAIAAAGRR